jgi:cytidylate kinase
MIIAIDGPAAAGKGTLAKRLAAHFDLAFLDTGRFYRAVGHAVLQAGDDPNDPAAAVAAVRALDPANVDTGDLYTERVAKAASVVAAMPNVRKELLVFQRTFAHEPPDGKSGAVLDGRDIASVVCPDATYKFFVSASPAERATRRFKELQENGVESTYAAVLADIEQRDQRDRTRKVSPLKVADARVIDTSDKTPDAVFEEALAHIEGEQST